VDKGPVRTMRTQAVCSVKQTLSHLPTHIEPVSLSDTYALKYW
jgi:hypothetical protein